MFKFKIILILIIFQLLTLGCLKEKNNEYSSVNFVQTNSSKCNEKYNNDQCLENFPTIKGPFTVEEKTKAIMIISRYFCLSNQKKLNDEPKQKVIDRFIQENIDLELINSYSVIKKANQISNLMVKSCDIENFDDEMLLKIIKSEIQQINTK